MKEHQAAAVWEYISMLNALYPGFDRQTLDSVNRAMQDRYGSPQSQVIRAVRQANAEGESPEQELADAFYRVTVQQRDSAWRSVERLTTQNEQLRAALAAEMAATGTHFYWCDQCNTGFRASVPDSECAEGHTARLLAA